MRHRHGLFVCGISITLLGCAPRSALETTPARVELRASDYAGDFELPESIELTLDCPSRFCVELRPASGGLPLPDDAAQASEVLSQYMDDRLLPTFRDRFGFAGAGQAAASRGGRALMLHSSDFGHLAAFVNAAADMMSHYRSPAIQVCAGTRYEL